MARLLTSKPFSAASLKKTMQFVWAPAQEIFFRDIEENRFLVQANCLGDWKKVTEQGPWIFREQGLLVEKFDGSCSAAAVALHRIHAWVRVHDVPELYRKKLLITKLCASIGEVLMVDMNSSGYEGGDYVRIRVWLDTRKSLTRFVSLKPEGEAQVIMRVKYEKIPRFCYVCGLMGHGKEECGTGEHSPSKEAYGSWLLVDTPWNRAQLYGGTSNRPSRRGRQGPGVNGGRGAGSTSRGGSVPTQGGRGRGADVVVQDNRKRTSTDAKLTEVSPVKANENVASAKGPLLLQWKEPGVIICEKEEGARKQLEFEDGSGKNYPPREGTPPPPPSAREQKRPKKQTTPKNMTMTGSAASGLEGRQSQ
ncbi:hypothetical protein QYE76_012138 [Lolium multiflorum]|uniref:Zinc knuckle CX2CX4HX4C domain-containing protein n=1 Tax=Lolium multiflorum TaxID=4521 RepID=A0AAD8TYA6_LOLMU|nr:hypothetical protein QYE76_012138 [Lolium multiflorum]